HRGRGARGDLEVFVNISQLTVSQMRLAEMTDSPQQRQHRLAEQVLHRSGLPVVHLRATVFLQHVFFLGTRGLAVPHATGRRRALAGPHAWPAGAAVPLSPCRPTVCARLEPWGYPGRPASRPAATCRIFSSSGWCVTVLLGPRRPPLMSLIH